MRKISATIALNIFSILILLIVIYKLWSHGFQEPSVGTLVNYTFIIVISLVLLVLSFAIRTKNYQMEKIVAQRLIESSSSYYDLYEQIKHESILTILNDSGDASYTQKLKLRVQRDNTDKYLFRFVPSPLGEVKDFHCKGNVFGEALADLTSFETTENNSGVEILVTLNRKLMKGEILELEASIILTKSFTEKEEFWIMRKMFLGVSEFAVRLTFPESKKPSKVEFCKLPDSNNKDFGTLIQLAGEIEDIEESQGCIFQFKTSDINIGQSLVAKWDW